MLQLEEQWAKAYLDRDIKALDRFEADDWSCTDAEGKVTSKAQEHADVGSGTYQATEFKLSDLKVRTHGDTAVITGRQTEVATMAGKDASAVFQITDTWFRRDGRWLFRQIQFQWDERLATFSDLKNPKVRAQITSR